MAETGSDALAVRSHPIDLDLGGLRFSVSFRGSAGATLRVSGQVSGKWEELLRFDDFVDAPHYHVPAAGDAIMVDRATQGDPLDLYITQLRDHLGELLETAGYADAVSDVDLDAVRESVERIRQAMIDCVPEGYTRVAGVGLSRVSAG